MRVRFWIRRFVLVALVALPILGAAHLLRGHSLAQALRHAILWSAVSAAVFTLARMAQSARGDDCALCNDLPPEREMPENHPH